MSEDDWERWRRLDPSDPASPYYTAHRPDTNSANHASMRSEWPSDAPIILMMSRDDRLPLFPWDITQAADVFLPPWAIIAGTCMACLGFLYVIGDRALALALGAIVAVVGLGIFLVRRGLNARPRHPPA